MAWYGVRLYRVITATVDAVIPVAKVQRGDVSLAVTARGEIRGGNPDVLTAPLTGGTDLHITTLKKAGEPVKEGEVVVEFDTTEQDYKLKEAEADLAEADSTSCRPRASAKRRRKKTVTRSSRRSADIQLAELDVRKNPLLAAITARQNTLALEAAQDHLAQLEHNLGQSQGQQRRGHRDSGGGARQGGIAGKDRAAEHRCDDAARAP